MSKKTFPVNAMVLAAGLGVRLLPLTEKMPKPLIPVGNCPMLKIVLDNLAEAGIKHFAINTHYLAEQIVDFVNASSYKTAVTTFHEPEILGTGGGPVNAKAMLSEHEYFIIHNSDILTDINLRKLLEHHFSSGNKITMAVLDGPENKLRVAPDGKIHDILDSLGCSPPGNRLLTYSGIMILHRDIFRYLPQQPENCSIIKAILAMMAAEPGCAGAYLEENCYWNDLGTLPQYFKAHHDVMIAKKLKLPAFSGIPEILAANDAKIDPTAELSGFVAAGSKSVINARAVLINCILLEGAEVKDNDFHCNEIIMPDFCIHRNFHELSRMKILSGVDLKKQRLSSLQEQGSARGFYRVSNGEESKILMVSDGMDQDFERFIYIGRFLGQFDFPTPLIYACEPEEFTILTEDLGNDTLYRLAFRHYNAEQLETVYRKVIDALVDFQSRGTGLFKRNDAPILRNFDRSYLRWETKYFSDNLLGAVAAVPENSRKELEHEFDLLAQAADSQPKIFMHRDFQSQNILLHNGRVRFVDFQGARIGPVGYDIMSLVNDPYMELPLELRRKLEKYYCTQLATSYSPAKECDLAYCLVIAGLQRSMQALGAYGYLGLTVGKKHYLKFIPAGLALLKEGLERLAAMPEAPLRLNRLTEIVKNLQSEAAEFSGYISPLL